MYSNLLVLVSSLPALRTGSFLDAPSSEGSKEADFVCLKRFLFFGEARGNFLEVAEHKMALRSSFLQTMPKPEVLLAVPGSDKDIALLKKKV